MAVRGFMGAPPGGWDKKRPGSLAPHPPCPGRGTAGVALRGGGEGEGAGRRLDAASNLVTALFAFFPWLPLAKVGELQASIYVPSGSKLDRHPKGH